MDSTATVWRRFAGRGLSDCLASITVQPLVTQPVGLVGQGAEPLTALSFIGLIIPFAPHRLAFALECENVRGYPVEEALNHVHEFGLHSIEFTDGHFSHDSSPEQIDSMKKQCADLEVKILGHGVNGFGKDHEANRKFFEFARLRWGPRDPSQPAAA